MTNTTISRTRRPAQPMTPIEITHSAPRLSTRYAGVRASRGSEIWAARSIDGTWYYERCEEPGTPWIVTHIPTSFTMRSGSLPKARTWTASDRVYADMRNMIKVEMLNCERNGWSTVIGDRLCSAIEAQEVYAKMLAELTAMVVLSS